MLCMSCTIDMGSHTIYRKTKHSDGICKFEVKQNTNWADALWAPCDCYEVGDSLNKYFPDSLRQ